MPRKIDPVMALMPFVDTKRILTPDQMSWLQRLTALMDNVPDIVAETDNLVNQSAAIAETELNDPEVLLPDGYYRLTWYLHVTRAATSSSSVEVTVSWVEDGVTYSYTGPALAGNVTTDLQSVSIIVPVDGETNVTYEVAYSSSGATTMQYKLKIVMERL